MASAFGSADLLIDGLTVRFSGVDALSEVSLALGRGEVVGIIGPNGAGKTTLFNAICGFVRPQAGSITYQGRSLLGSRPQGLLRLGIARTLQGLGLWPSLTVLENVVTGAGRRAGFASALLGAARSVRVDRTLAEEAREVLKQLGIEAAAGARPHTLPYGIQKRVTIARALMARPSLLLLDEPASGLSQAEAQELAQLLGKVRRETTLGIVDHNVELVMNLSDRVVVLNLGRVIASGTPEEIRDDPQVAQAYLGEEVH